MTESRPIKAPKIANKPKLFAEAWFRQGFAGPTDAYRAAGYPANNDAEAWEGVVKLLKRTDVQKYLNYLNLQQNTTFVGDEKTNPGENLEPRMKAFCEELIIDFDRNRAYRDAGYKPNTDNAARVGAHQLLQREDVQEYMMYLLQQHTAARELKVEQVLEGLQQIAFSDIRNVIDVTGKGEIQLKRLDDLPPHVTATISKITTKPNAFGLEVGVELCNKLDALKQLAKFFGADLNPNEVLARARAFGFLDSSDAKKENELPAAETGNSLEQGNH